MLAAIFLKIKSVFKKIIFADKKYFIIIPLFILTLSYQNCNNVRFTPEEQASSSQSVEPGTLLCQNPLSGQSALQPGENFVYYTIASGSLKECADHQMQAACLPSGELNPALPVNIEALFTQGALFRECVRPTVITPPPVVAIPLPDSLGDCPPITSSNNQCEISYNTSGNLSSVQLNLSGANTVLISNCGYGAPMSTADPNLAASGGYIGTLRITLNQYMATTYLPVVGGAISANSGKNTYLCISLLDAGDQVLKTYYKKWPIGAL